MIKVGDETFTRLYGGGKANQNVLNSLNITDKDIFQKLKYSITTFADKTRLFSDFSANIDDDWKYEYKILDQNDQIQVVIAKEGLSYKQQVVFIHFFILSPVKK